MNTNPIEANRRAENSTLCAMLLSIAAALRADSAFHTSGVTILTEDDGDINTRITQSCGNQGNCVVVMFAGTEGRNSIPGLCFDGINFVVELSELASINRVNGGRPSIEMAEEAAKILEEFKDPTGRVYHVDRIVPAPSLPEGADVAYHILIKTKTVKINRNKKG